MLAFVKGNSQDIKDEECIFPSFDYEKAQQNSAQQQKISRNYIFFFDFKYVMPVILQILYYRKLCNLEILTLNMQHIIGEELYNLKACENQGEWKNIMSPCVHLRLMSNIKFLMLLDTIVLGSSQENMLYIQTVGLLIGKMPDAYCCSQITQKIS